MNVPRHEPHVKSDAEATEEATLPLDGGNIYIRQDGPRDAPATPPRCALRYAVIHSARFSRFSRLP